MKKLTAYRFLLFLIFIYLSLASTAQGQNSPPREYIPADAKVSFIKSTPFNVALKALNEISVRLVHKVIIDPKQRTAGIGVNIDNLPWKTALELIAVVNGLSLIETDTYIQIAGASTAAQQQQQFFPPEQQAPDLKPVTKDLREITISATFFEADRKALREIGINWALFSGKGNIAVYAEQNVVGGRAPEDAGILEIVQSTGASDLSAFVKMLESSDAGRVIANPRITVADGRTGRVQIGQDFSIKQRDFAGNIIDVFISSGIILTVTPVLIEEDTLQFIHLAIQVERSSAIPGTISTVINKTQADTELLLNNGEKASIGGLLLTEETITNKGIPVLKNIPKWFFGLGYLFSYERIGKTEKELIILLKAEIVPTLEERLASGRGINEEIL